VNGSIFSASQVTRPGKDGYFGRLRMGNQLMTIRYHRFATIYELLNQLLQNLIIRVMLSHGFKADVVVFLKELGVVTQPANQHRDVGPQGFLYQVEGLWELGDYLKALCLTEETQI
jgi:hypothetical protein